MAGAGQGSGGPQFSPSPLPAKGGEAESGKADDHHRPGWRFRDASERSNLNGRKYISGATIGSSAVSRENPLRRRIFLPADMPERKWLWEVEDIVDVESRRAEAIRSVVRYVAAEHEIPADRGVGDCEDSRRRRLENVSRSINSRARIR
jgi:hypothetical protein